MESWLGATAAPSGPMLKIIQQKTLKDPRPRDICSASHLGSQHLAKCNLLSVGQNDGHTSALGSQQLVH